MPKIFTSTNQKIGEIGEHIACRYLENKGFSILDRNYTRKWGEIDIVSAKDKKTHFIEVKSTSLMDSGFRPEENMHPWKLKRLERTVATYLAEHKEVEDWQLDLCVVFTNLDTKEARVRFFENII